MDFHSFIQEVDSQVIQIFGDQINVSSAEEMACLTKPFQLTEETDESEYERWRNYSYSLGKLPRLTKLNWRLLAILSWYLPEVTGWELREYLLKRNQELRIKEMESYLQTKNLMLFILFKQYDFTHSTLFGNVLRPRRSDGTPFRDKSSKNQLCIVLRQRRRPRRRRSERKRGYPDHGSRQDEHKKGRFEIDNSGLKQLEIEEQRTLFRLSALRETKRRKEELLRV